MDPHFIVVLDGVVLDGVPSPAGASEWWAIRGDRQRPGRDESAVGPAWGCGEEDRQEKQK